MYDEFQFHAHDINNLSLQVLNSPQQKAQVSFSDHFLSVGRLSVLL